MRTEHDKARIELEVFEAFCALSKLPITPLSVQKRFPPEPDIICELAGEGAVAFELVELCDKNWTQAMSMPANKIPLYLRTSDPTSEIVCKKVTRSYPQRIPIELLCYTRQRILTPSSLIYETAIRDFLHDSGPFRRAWLLDRGRVHELWRSEAI